jgi:hypothetical protein
MVSPSAAGDGGAPPVDLPSRRLIANSGPSVLAGSLGLTCIGLNSDAHRLSCSCRVALTYSHERRQPARTGERG